jgi:CARDB protein
MRRRFDGAVDNPVDMQKDRSFFGRGRRRGCRAGMAGVKNAGNGDAGWSKLAISQPAGSAERFVDTPPIPAGSSTIVSADCPYGTVAQATIRVDSTNALAESNEDNNYFDTGLRGTGGRCRLP